MTTSGSKTFLKGLQILDALRTAGDDGLKITDIAAQTGVQRTTVYRFLDVLVDQGYALELEGKHFAFNSARFKVQSSLEAAIDRLKPVLRRISAQTGDSCFLVRRDGSDSLCVHREVGSYPIQVVSVTIGHKQPLGVGAAGLALLAYLPNDDIDMVLEMNKERLPNYGGMTCARMRSLIQSTRERGWSVVGNSAVPGVVGVGLPILQRQGLPLFAISVSSVLDRMPLKRQRYIVGLIKNELEGVKVQGSL